MKDQQILGISLRLRKFSLGLQKFRRFSENFAILAKLATFARPGHFRYALFLAKKHVFATHKNFAKLAKLRSLSEISYFRYLLVISLTSEIFAS